MCLLCYSIAPKCLVASSVQSSPVQCPVICQTSLSLNRFFSLFHVRKLSEFWGCYSHDIQSPYYDLKSYPDAKKCGPCTWGFMLSHHHVVRYCSIVLTSGLKHWTVQLYPDLQNHQQLWHKRIEKDVQYVINWRPHLPEARGHSAALHWLFVGAHLFPPILSE